MGIKVINEIKEVDYKIGEPPILTIKSHWSNNRLIVLIIHGKEYTFSASHLIKAITYNTKFTNI